MLRPGLEAVNGMINNKDESLSSRSFQSSFILSPLPPLHFFFYYLLSFRPQIGKLININLYQDVIKVMRTLAGPSLNTLPRKLPPHLPKTYLLKPVEGNGGKSEQIVIVSSTRLILHTLILRMNSWFKFTPGRKLKLVLGEEFITEEAWKSHSSKKLYGCRVHLSCWELGTGTVFAMVCIFVNVEIENRRRLIILLSEKD